MPVTDEQVATLRAYLAAEEAEYERLVEQLQRSADVEGYAQLVIVAFRHAVVRRFSPRWTIPEVIAFVAALRARLGQDADRIDPYSSERLIRATLGDGTVDDLDVETQSSIIVLLGGLIADERLDDPELDEFLSRVLSDEKIVSW